MSVPLSGNQNVYQLNASSNNDPRQFYDIHDHHNNNQGHFLDHQSQGFGDQHHQQNHQTSNVLAVPQQHIDQHQLLHANMNANMMRFMRNANAGKVYQKIVRMTFHYIVNLL